MGSKKLQSAAIIIEIDLRLFLNPYIEPMLMMIENNKTSIYNLYKKMVPKKAPISSIIFGISYQFMLDLLALLLPKYSDGQPNHAIELKGWKNNQNDQNFGVLTKKNR